MSDPETDRLVRIGMEIVRPMIEEGVASELLKRIVVAYTRSDEDDRGISTLEYHIEQAQVFLSERKVFGWAVSKRRAVMRIPIRTVSGATPVTQRPIITIEGRQYVDVADLADLWALHAEMGGSRYIAVDADLAGPILLVIDDYLD